MAIYNSDIMDSFSKGERVRTISHRGSLLSDIAFFRRSKTDGTALEKDDIIPIMPISYKSAIREVSIGFKGTTPTDLAASLDIYGLKKDGKTLDKLIKKDIFLGISLGADAASGLKTKDLDVGVVIRSVYDLLCEDKKLTDPNGINRYIRVPIDAFDPYQEDRFGVLAWTVGTTATAGDNTSVGAMAVNFVEVAPSSGLYLDAVGVGPKPYLNAVSVNLKSSLKI